MNTDELIEQIHNANVVRRQEEHGRHRRTVWRVAVPPAFRRYVFAKGYIALHGASLTVAEVNRAEGWFEVWLIPETRRATVFEDLRAGDALACDHQNCSRLAGPFAEALERFQAELGRLPSEHFELLRGRITNNQDY